MKTTAMVVLAIGGFPLFQSGEAVEAEKIRKEVEYANSDKPQFQVQAVERLKNRGAAAVSALLDFVERKGPNALTLACTELFGSIPDERLANLCARLVENKDFYWRPAAARSLAQQEAKEHRDLLRKSLKDHLWGVRAAAIQGLQKLDDRESLPEIRKLLNDEIYDVRAQAAKTMYAFGDESGLPVLVESLRSSVAWFDIDYGQLAREDAWTFLKTISGDDFGFKPWEPAARREAGLKRWEEWIAKRMPDWRDRIPSNAKVAPDQAVYEFGFELRSCRTGDYFFRVDAQNNLVLGYFNLIRAQLTEAERSKLDKAIEAVREVDRAFPYGQGGCDFEQYYLKTGASKFEKLWIGVGGRPGDLDGFIRTVTELLRAKFGDGEAKTFKDRTALFREMD